MSLAMTPTIHRPSRFAQWYARVAAFKVEDLFSRKKAPGQNRTIFVNKDLPDDYHDAHGRIRPEHMYATNQVITSKYTVVTFLPRNLLEQFRRVANVFFLFIDILQFFPKFSTISPGLVLVPLLIVLLITALKDGYEDIKRHQSDRRVNNSLVRILAGGNFINPNITQSKRKTFVRGVMRTYGRHIKTVKNNPNGEELAGVTSDTAPQLVEYDDFTEERPRFFHRRSLSHAYENAREASTSADRPHWKKTAWEDIAVGDFVKILDNESIPADILICSTSEEGNVAFVETKNLDGETNLKSRNAVSALTHLRSANDCTSPRNSFRIEAGRPDTNMFRLSASVRVGENAYPADMQMVLLRGTVLRNTKWVIGVILYTGEDTKIVLNSGGTPSKRSKVERQMNPQVFINLLLLVLAALACGIVESALEQKDSQESAPWLYGAGNPTTNGVVTFFFALIIFQNIIPISLYISIEFVRTCQAAFIYFDPDMFYMGQPALARSWNLSDDLGQIEYIISDKTGTLTQNSMIFRQCSIGGKVYIGDDAISESDQRGDSTTQSPDAPPLAYEKEQHLHEVPLDVLSNPSSLSAGPEKLSHHEGDNHADSNNSANVDLEKSDPLVSEEPVSTAHAPPKITHHFRDAELTRDLQVAIQPDLDPMSAAHARNLNGFFTVLALCHTVLTNIDPQTGKLEYKAQSPDEAALVRAAADVGFMFRGREKEILYLQTPFGTQGTIDERKPGIEGEERHAIAPGSPRSPSILSAGDAGVPSGTATGPHVSSEGGVAAGLEGTIERYELLNILEFTSARKRMSVILRKLDSEDGRLFLLCKGADNVIFERLKEGAGEEWKGITERHLAEFAGKGLRTLTLAYKVIGESEYHEWSQRYHEAAVSLENREEKIEAVSNEIEHDLRLLGATAIEDRLQDGVPETIADLKAAGIKLWVATGDKLETALAIGHSTNLISPQSNIIVIRGSNTGKAVYDQILNAVEEFFPDSGILDENGRPTDPITAKPEAVEPQSPVRQDEGGGPLRRVTTGISSIVGPDNGDRPGGFVLVIDGAGLSEALADDARKTLLLRLAMLCEGVICCRVSPLQKALMVKLIRDNIGSMTLAIGDGANDVSMIQAADIGVGISGEEGLQAVNSSDYAIAQFRFLKRLLLVHGHWSYARNGTMILNFFYKNIVCIGVLWWFQIYCGWSSNFVFDYTYLLFWNSFWTIAPVIGIGLFDRFADDHLLMDVPELYWFGREGKWFGIGQFIAYMLDGLIQSAIIYFLITYTYLTTSARKDGWQVGLYEFSTVIVFSAVFTANFFNGLNTTAWTGWVFFAVLIGSALLWVYTVFYDLISPGWIVTPVWGNNIFLFRSAYFWLCLPLTILLSLLPRYIYKAWRACFYPDDIDILRYVRKTEPDRDIAYEARSGNPLVALKLNRSSSVISHSRQESAARTESVASLPQPSTDFRSASRTDMSTGVRSIHRGFDFSTEENGVAIRRMQTNLSERRLSSRNVATDPPPRESGSLRRQRERISNALAAPRIFLRRKVSNSQDQGH